ncbi:uncharacterized protein LOC127284410 [Leptopilina boulardi]|uniref:uncharacterized protein LOC127284410 n=1 Tax=Leptopilina boulardi TaxID=63433 RepID=UPI0021F59D8D|nr:uncharacterized protein LOC127284410 [Leptopilina boulardi]
MDQKSIKRGKVCCNPFSIHGRRKHNLCGITPVLCKRFAFLNGHKNICSSCRTTCYDRERKNRVKNLENVSDEFQSNSVLAENHSHTSMDEFQQVLKNPEEVEAEEIHFKRKENISSALGTLFKEFHLKPVDSIDLSVPGAAEKKFDVLIEEIKKFFIKDYKFDSTEKCR